MDNHTPTLWTAEIADGLVHLHSYGTGNAAITVPATDDPGAAIDEVLDGILPPGGHATVLGFGWDGLPPVRVPCPPPRPQQGRPLNDAVTLYLLPALLQDNPPDLIGAPTAAIVRHMARYPDADGVLCVPGFPTVWAHISAAEIVSVRSFLTLDLLGAIFSGAIPAAGPGFTDAAIHAMSRPSGLAGDLSSVRALLSLGLIDAPGAQSRAAGLLIGAELAAARPWWLGQSVAISEDGCISRLYLAALLAAGAVARIMEEETSPSLAR